MAILVTLVLLGLLIASAYASANQGNAAKTGGPVQVSQDVPLSRSGGINFSDNGIDGQEECAKFEVLFRIFLTSVFSGVFAT